MKTYLLFLSIAVAIMAPVFAQPILTPIALNPVDGDVFYGHRINNISIGSGGAGVVWNFADLKEVRLDTTSYYTCDGTPFCIMYEGNNAKLEGKDNLHVNTGASSLSLVAGHNIGFDEHTTSMVYANKYAYVERDTFTAPEMKMLTYRTEIDTYIYDGYGTLILPTGTHTDVARVHTIAHVTDSSFSKEVTNSRAEYYSWYKPGFHNPLLIVRYDNAAHGKQKVIYASYFTGKDKMPTMNDANQLVASLSIYPHRSTDELYINFTVHNIQVSGIYITDLSGRVIADIKTRNLVDGPNLVTYPLHNFLGGTYFVHLATTLGRISKQVILEELN